MSYHQSLYKASGFLQKRQKNIKIQTEKRTKNRHNLFAQQREIITTNDDNNVENCMLPTNSNVEIRSQSQPTISNSVDRTEKKSLDRRRAYYDKFLKWKENKNLSNIAMNKTNKKPFTSTVPKNRFLTNNDGENRFKMPSKTTFEFRMLPPPTPSAPPTIGAPFGSIKSVKRTKQTSEMKMSPRITRARNNQLQLPQKKPVELPVNKTATKLIDNNNRNNPKVMKNNKKLTIKTNLQIPPPIHTAIKTLRPTEEFSTMITSTAQKSNKQTPKVNFNFFSPIEISAPISFINSSVLPPIINDRQNVAANLQPPSSLLVTSPPIIQSPVQGNAINYVSPYVTTKRGKGSAKDENKKRDSMYKLDKSINESPKTKQKKETAAYFRNQVEKETNRLLEIASQWETYKITSEANLLTEYVDLIDVSIGQARLLVNNKFIQFKKLIDNFEKLNMPQPVLAGDLEGFWSMVYMQVENCNSRFDKLEKLKVNQWIENNVENDENLNPIKKKKILPKPINKKKQTSNSNSNGVLLFIRQQMLKSKQMDANGKQDKSIKSSFVCTPQRRSMLQNVIINEETKVGTPRKLVRFSVTNETLPVITINKQTPKSSLAAGSTRKSKEKSNIDFFVSELNDVANDKLHLQSTRSSKRSLALMKSFSSENSPASSTPRKSMRIKHKHISCGTPTCKD